MNGLQRYWDLSLWQRLKSFLRSHLNSLPVMFYFIKFFFLDFFICLKTKKKPMNILIFNYILYSRVELQNYTKLVSLGICGFLILKNLQNLISSTLHQLITGFKLSDSLNKKLRDNTFLWIWSLWQCLSVRCTVPLISLSSLGVQSL